MIDTIIVSGGNIHSDFALDFLKKLTEKTGRENKKCQKHIKNLYRRTKTKKKNIIIILEIFLICFGSQDPQKISADFLRRKIL